MWKNIGGIGSTKDNVDKVPEGRSVTTEKEKYLRIILRRIAEANDIHFPEEDRPYDLEKQYLEMQINNMRQRGEQIRGVDFREEMFSEVVFGETPEDQLLFGRADWKPSVDACLSLIRANVVTAGDFQQIGFHVMEKDFGLKDDDARQLEKLLDDLDCPSRRPRIRQSYDDWRHKYL